MADFASAVEQIKADVMAKKAERAAVYAQDVLRASSFHPCPREMYYQVANWRDKEPPSPEKQCLFDFGNTVETHALQDLAAAGYKVTRQQQPFEIPVEGGIIRGHIDGWMTGGALGDEAYPVEIKGYTYEAERIDDWHEFLMKPQHWLRQVPAQLTLYMLGTNTPAAVLVMVDKKGAEIYPLPVELDYDYGESLLKKAELVYEHLAVEIPPDRIEYSSVMCGNCDFRHICQPLDPTLDDEGCVLDPWIVNLAEMHEFTKPASQAHDKAKEELKAVYKAVGRETLYIGPLKITQTKAGAVNMNRRKDDGTE
jgi:CRISPR/Cas system-associated exonuclease Cas4 (RecB family)